MELLRFKDHLQHGPYLPRTNPFSGLSRWLNNARQFAQLTSPVVGAVLTRPASSESRPPPTVSKDAAGAFCSNPGVPAEHQWRQYSKDDSQSQRSSLHADTVAESYPSVFAVSGKGWTAEGDVQALKTERTVYRHYINVHSIVLLHYSALQLFRVVS